MIRQLVCRQYFHRFEKSATTNVTAFEWKHIRMMLTYVIVKNPLVLKKTTTCLTGMWMCCRMRFLMGRKIVGRCEILGAMIHPAFHLMALADMFNPDVALKVTCFLKGTSLTAYTF